MSSVSSLIALGMMLVISASSEAQAAPLSVGSQSFAEAAVVINAIEPVHGCHRHYAQGMQGWHRHGSDCTLRRDLAEAKRRKKL
jgi:hypothetical protein